MRARLRLFACRTTCSAALKAFPCAKSPPCCLRRRSRRSCLVPAAPSWAGASGPAVVSVLPLTCLAGTCAGRRQHYWARGGGSPRCSLTELEIPPHTGSRYVRARLRLFACLPTCSATLKAFPCATTRSPPCCLRRRSRRPCLVPAAPSCAGASGPAVVSVLPAGMSCCAGRRQQHW